MGGFAGAFATSQALVSIQSGATPGTIPAIASVPSTKVNTLGRHRCGLRQFKWQYRLHCELRAAYALNQRP